MLQPWMIPADLTAGDQRSARVDWSGYELHDIRSGDDPLFETAYAALRDEFEASHELETEDVIRRRLERDPVALVNGCGLLYKLLLILKDGRFVGVRDQTAIVKPGTVPVVVHLSHNLVAPDCRRCGIAGWLRALPLQTAREVLARHQLDAATPVCLVAEMEPADPDSEARTIRLRAYEKAGFRKIDPTVIPYAQPDFRSPAEIDRCGGPQPLPLNLLIRRLGGESATSLPGAEVRHIAESLYAMYGADFRRVDLDLLLARIDRYPAGTTPVALIPPTATRPS